MLPNDVSGFSAYLLKYADFKDIPYIVFISVIEQFDIGLDIIKVYEDGLVGFNFFNGKLNKEYFNKNKIEQSDLKNAL